MDPVAQIGSQLLVGLVFNAGLAWGLHAWARSVAMKHGNTSWWRRVAWAPWVAFGLGIAGLVGFAAMMVGAFAAVSSGEASQKATHLAAFISRAMWAGAVPIGLSWALLLFSVVSSLVGSFKEPAGRTQP